MFACNPSDLKPQEWSSIEVCVSPLPRLADLLLPPQSPVARASTSAAQQKQKNQLHAARRNGECVSKVTRREASIATAKNKAGAVVRRTPAFPRA